VDGGGGGVFAQVPEGDNEITIEHGRVRDKKTLVKLVPGTAGQAACQSSQGGIPAVINPMRRFWGNDTVSETDKPCSNLKHPPLLVNPY
jgi:hypothetical protein